MKDERSDAAQKMERRLDAERERIRALTRNGDAVTVDADGLELDDTLAAAIEEHNTRAGAFNKAKAELHDRLVDVVETADASGKVLLGLVSDRVSLYRRWGDLLESKAGLLALVIDSALRPAADDALAALESARSEGAAALKKLDLRTTAGDDYPQARDKQVEAQVENLGDVINARARYETAKVALDQARADRLAAKADSRTVNGVAGELAATILRNVLAIGGLKGE